MPKFTYLAKTKDGAQKQGIVTASSEDYALSALQGKDLIVISLQDINKQSSFNKDLEIFNRVSARELVVATRILSVFLEVQIPLVQAISVLRDQNKGNKYFAEILDQLVLDLKDGNLLSDAIEKHPKVFDELFVSIIRSGEASGGLQEALLYMADYLEETYQLNSKIKGALAYPVFVLLIFVVLGLGIAYFVLPQLVGVLEGITEGGSSELPWMTQIVIAGSNFLQKYVWVVLIGLVGIVGGIVYALKTEAGSKFADKWKLKIPVFGQLFTKVYIARFATNLRNLLKAGVPLISSLEISSKVVGNYIFESIIQESIVNVKAGGKLSDTFMKHKEVPYIASQIISVGEKTAKTILVLETLTRFYKQEIDALVDNLTVLIEPIMIVGLGIGVAFFVLAVLMPIYNIAGSF
ncbi:type II secretion system F family protein [bacterium]|nr:type II secretion system F family protein [Candidatus Elulimicrobium humile]